MIPVGGIVWMIRLVNHLLQRPVRPPLTVKPELIPPIAIGGLMLLLFVHGFVNFPVVTSILVTPILLGIVISLLPYRARNVVCAIGCVLGTIIMVGAFLRVLVTMGGE